MLFLLGLFVKDYTTTKSAILWKKYGVAAMIGLLVMPNIGQACTSLLYKDDNGASYAGRTMELPMQLPYEVSYYPSGSSFNSMVKKQPELKYQSKYAFI